MADDKARRPAPLELGRGRTELEIYLEPTCPYSKRAFAKVKPLVEAVGEDRLTVRIRLLSQPWHLFSGTVTRAVIAASATAGGRDAAFRVMDAVYAERDDFDCEEHCRGPNMELSPNAIIRKMEALSGIVLAEAFTWPEVDRAFRWQVKYGRQNGIHVSPTFAINGLVEPTMSSGQSVEEWAETLRPYVEG